MGMGEAVWGAAQRRRGREMYPVEARSYRVLQEIGSGVSAVVYKAVCLPLESAVVAIKSVDLERSRANLEDVRREAKAMALLSHPNVLTAHCSFTVGSRLWVVMPFMAAGSLQSIISSSYPDGLSEPSIAVVLRETLQALSYLHGQGHIHRDIKAGNILVDSDGSVKLADFGVSASIYESQHSSSSSTSSSGYPHSSSCFSEMAGTPYWMAPEVIHSHLGYGIKADIWSFGITALELAHGRPPLSHLPLSKSLMMRITNRLRIEDVHDGGTRRSNKKKKKVSKAFKEMVAACLSQDPSKRPSADKLLRHPFFKGCKSPDYLVKNVLQAVPSVEDRYFKGGRSGVLFEQDGGEYYSPSSSPDVAVAKNRRISGWNFNVDVFQLDPVFPSDGGDDQLVRCLRFAGEEAMGKPDDQPSPGATSTSSSGSSGNSSSATADGVSCTVVVEDMYRDERVVAKGGTPKKACGLGGAPAPPLTSSAVNEALLPNLVSLLSSLELQRGMVMSVLACCAGGRDGHAEAVKEQREQQLAGLVRCLEQTVDELNVQLQREMDRNAALEEALDRFRARDGAGGEGTDHCLVEL